MVTIFVKVVVQDSRISDFERSLEEISDIARNRKGCSQYDWYLHPRLEQVRVIVGAFETESDFKAYLDSSLVRRIQRELIPLLQGPPEFTHLKAETLSY